jgi:6-pyruvoyltetrahydropterin/6-carboxytetrahydropterin synthase
MFNISKEITFEAAHRLPNHQGLCKNIHGHHYRVEMEIQGDKLEEGQGFLIDFSEIRRKTEQYFHRFDHACILWLKDQIIIQALDKLGMKIAEMPEIPTAENMAKMFFNDLSEILNTNDINLSAITVWETPTGKATYSNINL